MNDQNKQLDINENDLLFTNYTVGYKGIPFGAKVLLINNKASKTLDLIINDNGINSTINIQKENIHNVSYSNRTITVNTQKQPTNYEVENAMLAAALFGGNPIIQLAAGDTFNKLQDIFTNNYNKVKYNIEYEIEIKCSINNEEKEIVLTSKTNPEDFITNIKKND